MQSVLCRDRAVGSSAKILALPPTVFAEPVTRLSKVSAVPSYMFLLPFTQ